MKYLLFLIVALLAAPAAAEEVQPKLTLQLNNIPFRQALENLSKQGSVPVIAGPNIRATVTLALNDVTVEQAVATIAALNNLRWRKIDFALSQKDSLSAEEIAKAIAALEAVPVTGIVIADGRNKTQTVFGKDLPVAAPPQLAEDSKWQTVYLIQKPDEPVETEQPADDEAKAKLGAMNRERLNLLLAMPSEEREAMVQQEFNDMLMFEPEVRHDILRGWMSAMGNMDPQVRRDFFSEMRDVFREMRPEGTDHVGPPPPP